MDNLDRLIEAKKTKGLTPFVGTGATMAVTDAPVAGWKGMLEDGARQCAMSLPNLSTNWEAATRDRLQSGDVVTYLSVADEISRRLIDLGAWNDWIRSSVGRIEVKESSLHREICNLSSLVITTNYDTILEQSGTGHESRTWKSATLQDELGKRIDPPKIVVHIHGIENEPDTIILGSWQYQALLDDETAQYFQHATFVFNTLLFIGCGSGLSDPNIAPSLEFMNSLRNNKSAPHEHYLLVRGIELEKILAEPQIKGIIPVAFGREHTDLEPFIRWLNTGEGSRPTQDYRYYAAHSSGAPQGALLDRAGPAEEVTLDVLDIAKKALRAQGQVERRMALPVGIDDWSISDQLYVHERAAASVSAPADRLRQVTTDLLSTINSAEINIGSLLSETDVRINSIFQSMAEITAHCQQLYNRISKHYEILDSYIRLSEHYKPALKNMHDSKSDVEEVLEVLETLRRVESNDIA